MRKSILKIFYQPALFFFLLPIFQIILGTIFSLPYSDFNFLSFIVLYLFVLFNQMLENILLRIPKSDFTFSKRFFFTVEGLNLLTILYFGLRHSWLAGLVLILFTLMIQSQFLFSYYRLDVLAAVLAIVLKTVFFNLFSFYVGTGFIQLEFVPYYLGLTIPFFLYEFARVRPEMKKNTFVILLVLAYGFSVAVLWQHLRFGSLLLFLTLPFAWGLMNETLNRKSSAVFAINFSLFYVILVMVAVLQ